VLADVLAGPLGPPEVIEENSTFFSLVARVS